MSILAARIPGVFLPESLKERVVPAENIALGPAEIGDAGRERVAGTQTAFAVAGVLPQVPMSPRRSVARFVVIIRDPKPAIGKTSSIGVAPTASVQHLAQPEFAAVNPGIFSGAFFDPLA